MPKCIVRRANTTKKTTQLSSLPPLLQKIYLARKIESMNDIDRSLSALLPYQNLSNIEKAAARLADAIEKNQFILIIGDFDADGATST
ncbi:MAG: Single-stranded-DNA-specific exonuclease RecJ, partial [uncultured bacterium]